MSCEAKIVRGDVGWGGGSYLDAMAIECSFWDNLGAKKWVSAVVLYGFLEGGRSGVALPKCGLLTGRAAPASIWTKLSLRKIRLDDLLLVIL